MASEFVTEDYCELIARDGNHQTVKLRDKETLFLGRGDLTGINDELCAEHQAS